MKAYRYVLCIYTLLHFQGLCAQNDLSRFNVTHYTVEDGLPSNQLYYTHQDSLGNLWIASDHGVVKFDGQEMYTYGVEDGLPDEVVFKIYEDHKHRLWFLTYKGGICYLEKDKFIVPSFNARLVDLLPSKLFVNRIAVVGDEVYMACDKSADFYFKAILGAGVEKVDLSDAYKTLKTNNPSLVWSMPLVGGEYLGGIYSHYWHLRKNQFYAPTDVDTSLWQKKVFHKNKEITFYNLGRITNNRHVVKVFGDVGNKLIARQNKVLLSDASDSLYRYNFNANVLAVEKIQADYFFVLAGNGIMHFKDKVNEAHLEGHYFKSHAVSSVKMDKQGRFWVTTLHNGLFKVSQFHRSTFQIPNQSMNAAIARPVYFQKDTLRYVQGDTLYTYRADKEKLLPLGRHFLKKTLGLRFKPDRLVWLPSGKLFCDFQEFVLPPGGSGTLESTQWVSHYRNSYMHKLYLSAKNWEILGATKRGFFVLDTTGFQYDSEPLGFEEDVYCLVRKNEHEFFLGTHTGLVHFNTATHSIQRYGVEELSYPVRDMARDQYGRIWVLPKGKGVVILDGDSIITLNKASGLSSNVCEAILLDNNRAWVGTNQGLNLLDFDERGITRTRFMGEEDGLVSDYIDYISRDAGSIIAFSGRKFSRLTQPLGEPPSPPFSLLEKIEVGDTSYSIPQFRDIEVKAGDNDLTFHYRVNTLLDNRRIWYKHRLLGKEEDWTYTHGREARYLDLDPGNYTFQLMSRDAHGTWSKSVLEYPFFIPKYFYETWWFRIAVALFLVAFLFGLAEVYKKRQQKKMYVKHQLLRAGMRALKAQMNPHFMFNALNSVRHLLLSSKNEEADTYLTRFSTMLRGLLNDMEQTKTSLALEVRMLRNYLTLEKIRLSKTLDWAIKVEDGLELDKLLIPPMLIQPLLENAIWHGLQPLDKTGEILVRFQLEKAILQCIITDNGKGFDPSEKKTTGHLEKGGGMGLKNVKERLRLFSEFDRKPYTIKIESNTEGAGTKITIRIPQ